MVPPSISIEVRRMFNSGNYTKKSIADYFHIHPDTVANILKRCEDRDVYVRTTQPGNLLIEPYKALIKDWLSKGEMSTSAIYHKLRRHGAKLSLSTVQKAVRKIKYDLDISAIRYETTNGKQAQADYGTFTGYSANIDGIERALYGFFLILGCSRTKYVEFVTDMTTDTLIRCIENAFHYYGGRPEEILFDNMPQVVNHALIDRQSPDRALLPAFTSFADYYGFNIRLARVRRPQEKGKVERFVGQFESDFLPQLEKKTGHDLAELNSQALAWCDEVNSRVHSTTGKIPAEVLKEENLSPLPKVRYLDNHTVHVSNDGKVSYRGIIYSVDNRFANCQGEVIDLENTIFLNIDGEYIILGRRNLPVFIRHIYSHTKHDWHIKQKKKKVKQKALSKWIPDTFGKISVDWNLLTCSLTLKEANKCIQTKTLYHMTT